MKGAALFIAVFALALLIVPMVALSFDRAPATRQTAQVHTPGRVETPPQSRSDVENEDIQPDAEAGLDPPPEAPSNANASIHGVRSFRILDETTGRVETVSLRDFVRGAVAAEMPVSFHPEALKAQAVAAHTFALHNHIVQQQTPDASLKGADFSADPSNMLVYTTEAGAKEFYGEKADLYWDKICQAADSVVEYVLEYDDEPIVAAYHAISAGQTEDAANIWTGEAPYLQSSDSEGDLLAPDYETKVTLSRQAVQHALQTAYPVAELPRDPQDWFGDIRQSASGYIVHLDVGGVPLHGKDIRTLFDLRSHNMDINYDENTQTFTFLVCGYGHGVGLSQYGADFMARQGYTFDEILRNYYTGVTLKQIVTDSLV